MPPFFAVSLLHPNPIKHREEQALTALSVKHLETLWILFCVAPKPLRLPKTKQKKTEESFENNVMKRKSISYAFLRVMTSIKEKELMDHNLRRTLCHTTAETFGQSYRYCIFKESICSIGPENSMMALNNKWLAKSQSLLAVCLQETCICWAVLYGPNLLYLRNRLTFQHEFEFSGEPAVRKKIWDVELK